MTSFIGFTNDATHSYTIGITVVEHSTNYFAWITAVPVFKKIMNLMIDQYYLKPMQNK